MEYDELKKAEDLKWKRVYEYRCCFCRKKRKTRSFQAAKVEVCNPCKKARAEIINDQKQMKLF